MMLRILLLTLLMNVSAVSVTTALAAAQQVNKKVISAKQAAKIVQNQYGGKVLKVSKTKSNNGFKVKIVKPNGQVVSKRVNAKTGKIEKN